MKIKRYEGQYVHEVIERIREDLGTDAVVLHTHWRNPHGLKRLLGKPQVEVWAGTRADMDSAAATQPYAVRAGAVREAMERKPALDLYDDPEPARPTPATNGNGAVHQRPLPAEPAPAEFSATAAAQAIAALLEASDHGDLVGRNGQRAPVAESEPPLPPPLTAATVEPEPELPPEQAKAEAEDMTVALLGEFSRTLARMEEQFSGAIERVEGKLDNLAAATIEPEVEAPDESPRLAALYAAGVDPAVAEAVFAAAGDRSITEVLFDTFQCATPLQLGGGGKVVALVGPSGVGKTTTVAKLAGHYAVNKGANVLLASTDNRRIGTFEQIKAIGQLMEIPTCALRSPGEAQARVHKARGEHDLVLVDTAACVHSEGAEWEQLLDTLIAVEPDQIHVVVSAQMKTREVERLIGSFRQVLPLEGVIVTKCDEAADAGLLADIAWRCLIPFTYLGTGQSIPGDLEVAAPERLLQRVWSTRFEQMSRER